MPKLVPPKNFICPLSKKFIIDPVVIDDGYSYERKNIEEWLKTHDVSPIYNHYRLAHKNMISVSLLKEKIKKYREKLCTQDEFFAAVKTGDPTNVDKLNFLDEHVNYKLVYVEEFVGIQATPTALTRALESNHFLMAMYLLENDASPHDTDYDSGWTPLHIAVSKGHVELVKLLLAKGANKDSRTYEVEEELPIDIAKRHGFTEIEALLLKEKNHLYVENFFGKKQENKELPNIDLQKLSLNYKP